MNLIALKKILFQMSKPAAPSGGKPAMERKRRARINESLSQLKLLIMDDLVDQVLHVLCLSPFLKI